MKNSALVTTNWFSHETSVKHSSKEHSRQKGLQTFVLLVREGISTLCVQYLSNNKIFCDISTYLDNFVLKKSLVPSGYVMSVGQPVSQLFGITVDGPGDTVDFLPCEK